ncbi:MAG: DEAD/DEAH box helicase family protein, partial [Selenomonadaceae bacterium]|nr:DEAD/DEAH box helicase family protein [Selenomonadaceae bacterium]
MNKIMEDLISHVENSVTILSVEADAVPSNTFMRWLRSMISSGNINIVFEYVDSKRFKWVSDALDSHVSKWNIKTPVFISAQTGTGKNTFIRESLLTKVYFDNVRNGSNKRILLLSNRVALNRQSKYQYAEYIRELTGDSSYIERFKKYTAEGIDEYVDFGIITICSYHQLYERKLLDNKEYDYIICDECHFFTSDAIFNIETDKILEYIVSQGKNSVRIYMTATIETVFEAIVREEFGYLKNRVDELFLDLDKYSSSADYKISLINKTPIQILNPCEDDRPVYFYSIADAKNYILETMSKKFCFYYMSRNYDYIKNIYVYRNHEELAEAINASADKWLVFVNELPKKDNEDPLNELKRSFVQLSREKIDNSKKAREVYDKLIEKESFDSDVLIATSLLNNGINISDEKVKNIVIDVFDRTEFIQMLGRVRVKSGDSINLYIREYKTEELKTFLRRDIGKLVLLLYMDILNGFNRFEFYERLQKSPEYRYRYKVGDLFRFENNDKITDYNKNAVLQIIDSASRIFNLIRKTEENYVVELNRSDQDSLTKVREYYIYGEGRNKSWSRNVVDLLETKLGLENRNECINIEKTAYYGRDSLIEEKYYFKFNDTFTRYLYGEMIPKYFDNKIADIISKLKNSYNWRYYQLPFNNLVGKRQLSNIEEFEIIQKIFRKKEGLDISMNEED